MSWIGAPLGLLYSEFGANVCAYATFPMPFAKVAGVFMKLERICVAYLDFGVCNYCKLSEKRPCGLPAIGAFAMTLLL